jgi:hypothetical protein
MMRPYYPVSQVARRQHPGQKAMLRLLAGVTSAALLGLALVATDLAHAQSRDAIARFDGGIGVQPALLAGAPNTVNDTQPAGRPWVIADLKAQVNADGTFDVRGKGLILAGGPNVGRSGNLPVRIRLYCGPLRFTSEETVVLEPNGDFRLRGQLPFVNPLPDCPNAVLLVLNAGASAQAPGGWFAAGIPKE